MHIFHRLGIDDTNVLLKYFHIFVFCSGRAVQRYIDNDNPTLVSDMASENIKCASLICGRTILGLSQLNFKVK